MIALLRFARWFAGLMLPALLLTLGIGCGGANVATVEGKVVDPAGKAVTGGTLIFTPVAGNDAANAGRPSSAEIGSDGTFKLKTTDGYQGAQIGKNRVRFTPPEPQMTEEQRTDPKYIAPAPPYLGLTPNPAEVEIQAGTNNLEIKLKAGK
ncbi:MAG: hypothetical protein LC104_12030 [Bacteroidales bacterium]|nr:hypothetical protein [Bacteroidales bacterium]